MHSKIYIVIYISYILVVKMEQEFNMNLAWLENINTLIKTYMLSRFEDDFDAMYKSLDMLEMITSPKIDKDEVETKLEWLQNNLGGWCVRDDIGEVVKIHEENKIRLQKEFNEVFRLILVKLNDKGILTKIKQDPGKAMGDFSDS